MNHNLTTWLLEAELPNDMNVAGTPPVDAFANAANRSIDTTRGQGDNDLNIPKNDDPNIANLPTQNKDDEENDITQDPDSPDMPEEREEKDFETWKTEFFKLAIRGDVGKMIDSINEVRDDDLEIAQRKFVEDNLQILFLRQDANIDKASKEIRRLIKDQLDQNSPGVSIIQHLSSVVEIHVVVNNIFIKLAGFYALRGELHRKFIGSILGALQVGGGSDKEDLIYSASDYSINISTRCLPEWKKVSIGGFAIQENFSDKYLDDSEQDRLENGSPEEKIVILHRLLIEAISDQYKKRSFIVNVINPTNGTIDYLGMDLSEVLRSGYQKGTLVLRPKKDTFRSAAILEDNTIVPTNDFSIFYAKDSDQMTELGKPPKKLVPFMEREEGKLYLTASSDTLEELSSSLVGLNFKRNVYNGNPSDLRTLIRCQSSINEMLLKRC